MPAPSVSAIFTCGRGWCDTDTWGRKVNRYLWGLESLADCCGVVFVCGRGASVRTAGEGELKYEKETAVLAARLNFEILCFFKYKKEKTASVAGLPKA